jgi:threonine dehydrogenase-like Zn-dependent dehydrogenase
MGSDSDKVKSFLEPCAVTLSIACLGGAVGRVGIPQDEFMPVVQPTFYDNITIAGSPAPAHACIKELLPDVLEGRIELGRVFDWNGHIENVPDGYRAMNNREAIKALVEF